MAPPTAVRARAGMLRWRGTAAALESLPNAALAAPTGATDDDDDEAAEPSTVKVGVTTRLKK